MRFRPELLRMKELISAMKYFMTVLLVVIFDQVTKALIVASFSLYDMREIIPGFFNLVYVTNPGAAFSMLAKVDSIWRHYFFVTIGIFAVAGISWYAWKIVSDQWQTLALGLICGGALGNLIDRVRFGAVVDFLDFYIGNYHWPAFNIADSAICLGAAVFLLVSFVNDKKYAEGKT